MTTAQLVALYLLPSILWLGSGFHLMRRRAANQNKQVSR